MTQHPYIEMRDIRDSKLARLARYPGTHDRERYARAIRAEVHDIERVFFSFYHPEEYNQTIPLVLGGLLRAVKYHNEVAHNQGLLISALELLSELLPGFQWDSRTPQ